MSEKEIITAAMKACGLNQETLAVKAGYKTQSAISNRLGGKSMRVDTLVKILGAMGYEVVVRGSAVGAESHEWTVSYSERPQLQVLPKPEPEEVPVEQPHAFTPMAAEAPSEPDAGGSSWREDIFHFTGQL